MSLLGKIRRLLEKLRPYDVFISYRQSDSAHYATALAAELDSSKPKLRTFLDIKGFAAGETLSEAMQRDLRRSSLLVVLVTPKALDSPHVRTEIEMFSETNGLIVPIDFNTLASLDPKDPIGIRLREKIFISADPATLPVGPPPEVAERLRVACQFTRSMLVQMLYFAAIAAVFVLLAIAAAVAAFVANDARLEAERRGRVSTAQQLASRAIQLQDATPQQAAVLAVEAALQTKRFDQPVTALAEQALRDLGQRPPEETLALHAAPLVVLEAAKHQPIVLTGGYDGLMNVLHLEAHQPVRTGLQIFSHHQSVYSLASHPSTKWIAIGGRELAIYRTDSTDPQRVVLQGLHSNIEAVRFDETGRWLAAVDSNGQVQLWSMAPAGPNLPALTLVPGSKDSGVSGRDLSFRSSDMLVAALGDKGCLAWDLRKAVPTQIALACTDGASRVRFSPDGRHLAVGGLSLRLYSVADDLSASLETQMPSHEEVQHLSWSPDSRWIVTAFGSTPHMDIGDSARNDAQLELWDTTVGGKPLVKYPLRLSNANVSALAFNPTSGLLAAGDERGLVAVWQLIGNVPRIARTSRVADEAIRSMTFAADGSLVIGDNFGVLKRWLAEDILANDVGLSAVGFERVRSNVFKSSVYAIDSTRHWLAAGLSAFPGETESGTLEFWDLASSTRQPVQLDAQKGHVYALGFSPDAKKLVTASGDGAVRFWNTATLAKTTRSVLPERTLRSQGSLFSGLGLGRATTKILFADRSAVRIVDFDDNTADLRIPISESDVIYCIALSDDGEWFAAATIDGTIWYGRVDDTRASRVTLPDLAGEWKREAGIRSLAAMAFAPKSATLVLAPIDGSVGLVSLQTLKPLTAKLVPPPTIVKVLSSKRVLAFSADGRWLWASTLDGVVQRIDLTNPAVPQQLPWRAAGVAALAVNDDGSEVVVGGTDGALRLWRNHNFNVDPVELRAHRAEISKLTFVGNRWLFSAEIGFRPTFWPMDVADLAERVCRGAGRNLTAVEWHQYFGDTTFARTCPDLPVDRSVYSNLLERLIAQINSDQRAAAKDGLQRLVSLGERSTADVNGSICWFGALLGFSTEAAPSCQRSREMELQWDAGAYGDSRAVALAMQGQLTEAAAELKRHLQWRTRHTPDELVELRRGWLATLEDRQNPFTESVRKELLESEAEGSWKLTPFDVIR